MLKLLEKQVLQIISKPRNWWSPRGGFWLDEIGWGTLRAYGLKRSEAEAAIDSLWNKGMITISPEEGNRVVRVAKPARARDDASIEELLDDFIP
ncbi:MAG TPA: hypothetical protein VHP11_04815 [Tepidisphaeraceae bacterium]|nr:hypothetical protein [Tepidisphaeraceae bacterium]